MPQKINSLFAETTRPGNSAGGFFITGTDTDVGKTYVSGCIAHTFIENGFRVIPRKPIASGCIKQADGSLLSEDALFLQQSCQTNEPLQTICPYQFEPAISPQTAIQQAGLTLNNNDLLQACQPAHPLQNDELLLVEGAGGFYSPLCSDGLNKDLAQALNLPVILVVKNQLGCINHTLLTLAAIKQAGLPVWAIIVNFSDNGNHSLGLESLTNIPIYSLPTSSSQKTKFIPGLLIS
ncbi:dethiobiotin synthase [Thiomicrorhabdus sp. Milos-T2]|uniref:dethiobiotin synthase n=1 Tax=Thiomicrorhabdus sp. Milos-T2 TaxID=90814 RepID=UPI000493D529|nr:dethiobiotin synthase [Thiomicrorhabdus sp. Milos-T2]